jgi:hypothetical protein
MHPGKLTTPCNGTLTTGNTNHPILRFFTTSLPNQSSTTSSILSILPLRRNQPPTDPPPPQITYPPPAPQITYPPAAPQITYPMQNNNPQIKNEANPPPQPPPRTKEPQQQSEAFPTHGTILTITGGFNIVFNTKRQC